MPAEPLSCNRKDFFKEKKNEKSDSVGSFGRWKDTRQGSREFGRWGQNEFRRPSGHGKQGGYQLFSKESGHGCTPAREGTSDRTVGDERGLRSSATRGDGKNGKNNNRAIKRTFQDLKGHPCETGDKSARLRPISSQSSVSDLLSPISNPNSNIENSSWDQLHFEDHNNKMSNMDGQSLDPMAWTPLKWDRSSSLSSRGSGLSHSSSTKSSDETKLDLLSGRLTPLQSPSGDDVGAASSSLLFEETCSRKKQRLGWGQGLAKYEKRKVEGSDETVSKNGMVPIVKTMNTCQSIIPSLPDKSPRVTGLLECASPVTTSSFACSSSPGMEDNIHFKGVNSDTGTSNLSASPGHSIRSLLEGFSVNLENLELNSATKVRSLLIDLLQLEDASSGDSNFVNTATDKLLLLKSEFLNAIEKIEGEIDLLENEHKLLNSEPEINGSCPTSSDSLQVECTSKSQEVGSASKVLQKPVPLQLVSSDNALEEVRGEVKDEDIDSPGTATSKFIEPLTIEKHNVCSADIEAGSSTSSERQPSMGEENTGSVPSSGDGNHQNENSNSAHVSSDLGKPRNAECKLNDLILASNRDCARGASEVFNKLLPTNQSQNDIWGTFSRPQTNVLVKEKLAMRKCSLRFKERVLTLKFRAFQHLWKEDMRLLSVRKHRAKSQKRFELSSRTSLNTSQKNRSSIRSRFTSPAGNLTLVPTTEIVDFNSKLLSDSRIKPYRNCLKMPALILHEERNPSRFVTSNGLVEDPYAVEKERTIINPWTPEEKEVFLEMLATYGKDFKIIASFLEHKTTADCIEFYYKNHKSESFKKIKKKSELTKQERGASTNTYLMTSGKKWNREVNAVSLDILQAASVIAAHADDNSMKTRYNCVRNSILGGDSEYKTCFWGDDGLHEKSDNVDILASEREAMAADALTSICGALSSEAVSSCVTSSVEPGESCHEWKLQKRNSIMERSMTPEVMQSIADEETCSDESCGEEDSVDWTDDDKSIFIGALRSYGKDFAKISRCVRTKSRAQCKIFFSKARKFLGLDVLYSGLGNEGMLLSDGDGENSDTEDACVLEMESAFCSNQSCSKMDVDFKLSATDMNCEAVGHSGTSPPSLSLIHTSCKASGHLGASHSQTAPGRLEGIDVMKLLNHEDAETKIVASIDDCPQVVPSNDAVKTNAVVCDLSVPLNENADLIPEIDVAKKGACPTLTLIGESVHDREPAGLAQCISNTVDESNALPGSAAEGPKTESQQQQISVHGSGNADGRDIKTVSDTNNSRSTSITNRNASHLTSETRVRPRFRMGPSNQSQISLTPWQQENCPGPTDLVSRDFSAIHNEGGHLKQITSSTTAALGEPKNIQHHKLASADVYKQYLLHFSNQAESSQILRGYPLHELNKKEMNGHADLIGCEKHGTLPPNQFLLPDLYQEIYNGSKPPHTVASSLPVLSTCQEQSSMGHSKSHSQCSSDTENSCPTGDFKLFGKKIISQPLQKNITTTQETNDTVSSSRPESSSKSFKLTNDVNYSSLKELPTRSYGFWDGNRIQTGFSSLPDSAILMSKYPTAFGNLPASSLGLPAVIKRNDRNMGCVSVFPSTDLSGNGHLSDYQVYSRSYDRTNVQPLTEAEVKRHEALCKQQKRNGFEASSFQQQARGGLMDVNVLGAAGISDPVAAIKMHYAATEWYRGQIGSVREEETWRGGDIGR